MVHGSASLESPMNICGRRPCGAGGTERSMGAGSPGRTPEAINSRILARRSDVLVVGFAASSPARRDKGAMLLCGSDRRELLRRVGLRRRAFPAKGCSPLTLGPVNLAHHIVSCNRQLAAVGSPVILEGEYVARHVPVDMTAEGGTVGRHVDHSRD